MLQNDSTPKFFSSIQNTAAFGGRRWRDL